MGDDLAEVLRGFGGAHLLTVGTGPHPHAVPVTVRATPDGLRVADAGRTSRANAARHGAVTLLWAPPEPGGYSLIVDGTVVPVPADAVNGPRASIGPADDPPPTDGLLVVPTRAVLHRPASGDAPPSGDGCTADCVEIPIGRVPDRR